MQGLLILKQDALGDALICSSVIQIIQNSQSEMPITVLGNDFNKRVFDGLPGIRALVYPKSKGKPNQMLIKSCYSQITFGRSINSKPFCFGSQGPLILGMMSV